MESLTAVSPFISGALAQPQTQFGAPEEDKTPYEGPYLPTERQARFPTEEEQRQLGSKEYQYFDQVQPYPGFQSAPAYAEGGITSLESPDDRVPTMGHSPYGLTSLTTQSQPIQLMAEGGEVDYGLSRGSYSIPPAKDEPPPAPNRFGAFGMLGGSLQQNQNTGFLGRLAAQVAQPAPPPEPAYTPPPPPQPFQGPTSAYQGRGITSLPQQNTQPQNPILGDFTSAVQQAIGLPRLAKGGYLDGPGDGMSDSIPATISDKQPARLADGEFVIPADVVSHLGNGSTKAGAQRLYKMMDKVRKARTGTTKQGKQINPNKYLPA